MGPLQFARRGETYAFPILPATGLGNSTWDFITAAGGFVYFHSTSESAIGRISIP